MKKIFIMLGFVLIAVTDTFAQTMSDIGMFSPRVMQDFSNHLRNGGGLLAKQYREVAFSDHKHEAEQIGALEATSGIDTPREFLYLSGCTGVVNVIPVEAQNMLGTIKQGDLIRGADAFKEAEMARFTGNKAREGQYEGMLKIIIDRKNVTRAEIEAFYRSNDGIKKLISNTVDAEFGNGKVDNTTLTQIYASWERQGFVVVGGKAVNGTELLKQTLTNFFLNPAEENYIRVRGILARILQQDRTPYMRTVETALSNILISISPELQSKLKNEFPYIENAYAHARQPNDPAFRIFEIPYAIGGNGR